MRKLLLGTLVLMMSLHVAGQDTPDALFKLKYAALQSQYKPFAAPVTSENIAGFREQFKRLATGLQEIEMYKFGGFPPEGAQIFELKELKKIEKNGSVDQLQKLMQKTQLDLKRYLGQNDQYGIDKMECLKAYSNLKQSMKRKDIPSAFGFWRELYEYYPLFKNAYSKGDKLILAKINESSKQASQKYKSYKAAVDAGNNEEANKFALEQKKLVAQKELWVDTLLLLYDQEIKYFGKDKKTGEGYLLGKKGGYIMDYKGEESMPEAYACLKQSVDMQKEKSYPNILMKFFTATMKMLKIKKIDPEEMVKNYTTSVDYLKKSSETYNSYLEKEKTKSTPNKKKMGKWKKMVSNNAKVLDYITRYFASAEESKCEYLVPAFEQSYEKRKSDKEWLKNVTGILATKQCTDAPLYGKCAEALYQTEPSANAAFNLALFYLKEKKYSDASKYFEEAYTQEKDNATKGEYYYYAAVVKFAQNKYAESRTLAGKSANLKPNFGKPYILIAKLYAASAGSCGSDKFERCAVYWAAVDKLVKAKSIDSDPEVTKEAGQLIGRYSARYPNAEEGFMRSLVKGASYKVGCWIQENTTVRY